MIENCNSVRVKVATDYGRGYLDGVLGALSMLLKISKEAEKYRKEEYE